jgi:hypothetical protein
MARGPNAAREETQYDPWLSYIINSRCTQYRSPQSDVHEWTEMFKSCRTSDLDADR